MVLVCHPFMSLGPACLLILWLLAEPRSVSFTYGEDTPASFTKPEVLSSRMQLLDRQNKDLQRQIDQMEQGSTN